MNNIRNLSIFLLRVTIGWYLFYSGLSKVLDKSWTAAGFLNSAKTFPGLYSWFASAGNIGWINFINEWGMLLIGIALILGIFVRWAALGGILLMALYYFPGLVFPYVPGGHGFVVDEHIIYIAAFLVLITTHAGSHWGLDKFWRGKI